MKQIFNELEEMSLISQSGDRLDSSELFFDDEPIDNILYGAGQGEGPNRANLFRKGRFFVDKIVAAYDAGRTEDLICSALDLCGSGEELSSEMRRILAEVMLRFVPACPYPVMKYDILPLGPLLQKLWQDALLRDEEDMIKKAGFVLSRWCENHGLYQESREVLGRLKLLYRHLADRPEEAGTVNGIGFTYVLEKKWQKAIPFFEEAARAFKELQISFRYANARCNYWSCRFELGDMGEIDETEKELKELSATLCGEGRWHERKPLILRAKLEENRDDIDKAILLVRQAIEVTQGGETRYSEFDGEYLERLRSAKKE
jgi:tetratricopeptide (TPR) repeat protein